MLGLLAGLFLGWSLGANDAANCFGTAVSSRMVSWRHATILAAIFVVTGAILQGQAGLETLQALTATDAGAAGRAALAAALTMTALTMLRLPASASQAVVGAYVGSGLTAGQVNLAPLVKIVAGWVGTPIGAMLFAAILYHLLRWPWRRQRPSLFVLDRVLYVSLVICGCYSAYALGASNVANVASFLVQTGATTAPTAIALGGLAMAIGVLTFSRGVMLTVGRGITPLDAFAALVVVLAAALTVHLYALLGVPVSTTQAMVGAVLGISLVKGVHILNLHSLTRVLAAWIIAPLGAAGLGALFAALT